MTLDVGAVKTRVKRQFGDESGVQITDSDIYNWISDALRNVILNGSEDVLEVTTLIDLVANQQDYALPTDLVSIKSVTAKSADSTSYFDLTGYSLREFNKYVDGWDGTFFGAGTPAIYMIYEQTIKLFPIPDTDNVSGLKLRYTSYLAEITGDNATIGVPNFYFNAVVNYCLQQAYELDEDWIGAQIKSQQVAGDLKKGRGKLREQQDRYPMITILDDDRW